MFCLINKPLSFIFVLSLAALQVNATKGNDDDSMESKSTDNVTLTCNNLSLSSDAHHKCIILKLAIDKLQSALESIANENSSDNNDDKLFRKDLQDVMVSRVGKLKDLLNKLNVNQGFGGLMQSFRIFGYPMSKIWALFVLLDPFEL